MSRELRADVRRFGGGARRRLDAALRRQAEREREDGLAPEQLKDARVRAAEALAAQADDPDKVRAALVDSAGMSRNLWITFLTFGTYLVIAVGAVTHRQLFLEEPVRLPLLNVDLPLVGFFVVAPLLFLIFHLYLLLHLKMMADDVRRYTELLRGHALDPAAESHIRQQLPNFIFVRLLGGPRNARGTLSDWLLIAIAWLTVAVGPVILLVMTQLQFLPYHLEWVTWVQRAIVVLDMAALWLFWPAILKGVGTGSVVRFAMQMIGVAASVSLGIFCIFIAAFPGERIYDNVIASSRFIPVQKDYFSSDLDRQVASLTEYLFYGKFDLVTGAAEGWLSNRLVLPNHDFVEDPELAALIARQPSGAEPWKGERTLSFRGRDLRRAVLARSDLRRADFTGSVLHNANLEAALLDGALFGCAWKGDVVDMEGASQSGMDLQGCAELQGATLDRAELKGASLEGAQLQNASLSSAQLQGALLDEAQLQYAILDQAQLQGASLYGTGLQGARFYHAHLQGAFLVNAELHGAFLQGTQLLGASLIRAQMQAADLGGAKLQGASLDKADLQGASLYTAELQGATFKWAGLQGALLDEAQLQGSLFINVQMQGASLEKAALQGARFENSNLWRTSAAETSGIPVVVNPILTPVVGGLTSELTSSGESHRWATEPLTEDTAHNWIDTWLGSVPEESDAKEEARERLDVLILGEADADSDEAVADFWAALGAKGSEGAPERSEEGHAQTFSATIRSYACDGGANAAVAIRGMLNHRHLINFPVILSEEKLGTAELARDLLECSVVADLQADTVSQLQKLAEKARPLLKRSRRGFRQ